MLSFKFVNYGGNFGVGLKLVSTILSRNIVEQSGPASSLLGGGSRGLGTWSVHDTDDGGLHCNYRSPVRQQLCLYKKKVIAGATF